MGTTWRTNDTALAAFLVTCGQEVTDYEWERTSCYFVFTESDDLLDAVEDFIGDNANVNPREYNMALVAIKRAMFDRKPAEPVGPRRAVG